MRFIIGICCAPPLIFGVLELRSSDSVLSRCVYAHQKLVPIACSEYPPCKVIMTVHGSTGDLTHTSPFMTMF